MPSKNKTKTAASSLLNRTNQRRSRERHRIYVSDLEQRVRQYERHGVHATLEMQRVARATTAENQALRSLLASQGLTPTNINAHVHAVVAALNGPSLDPEEKLAQQPRISEGTSREQQANRAPNRSGSQYNRWDSFQIVHPNRPDCVCNREPAHGTNDDHTDPKHTDHLTHNFPSISPERQCGLNRAAVLTPEAPPSASTPWEKPCAEAAAILAQLRGDSELADVRRDLGCLDEGACVIRNTELLQIMDNRR